MNLSFDSNPPPATTTSTLNTSIMPTSSLQRTHLCEVQPLTAKSVRDEIRAHKDLFRLADEAVVVLDAPSNSPATAVDACLRALVNANRLSVDGAVEAKNAILGKIRRPRHVRGNDTHFDSNSRLPQTIDQPDDSFSDDVHWRRHVSGNGFIIPFANLSALDENSATVVALARLSAPSRLGVLQQDELTRYVIVCLGPAKEVKGTKNAFELARSFATALHDERFRHDFKYAKDQHQVKDSLRDYVERQIDNGKETDFQSGEVDVFARTGRIFGGLIADLKRRYNLRVYRSDWTDGITDGPSIIKYISTIVWLYFSIIMPTIAFGALDSKHTNQQIGVIETIISQAMAGLVFSIFAGQPLTIVMTTAPLTVFIDVLFRWCKALNIPFLPFYAWTGFWTAIILLVLVATDACFVMKYCGHFTEEIFAMLIAALFVGEYVKPLIKIVREGPVDRFQLAFILATGTFIIANSLLQLRRSFLLKPVIRQLLADFGVPIAILLMSVLRLAFPTVDADMLQVPDKIGIVTTSGRSWIVPIFNIGAGPVFLALVSGLLLATLFFLDQNISSILVNRSENKLRKGPGYNLDLVIVSVIVVIQSIFGMPWTHAALPHSPLHARQLADVAEYEAHGRRYERVVKARETRITGFVTHILIGLSILMRDALKQIPLSVLYGFFLFLGICTLDGNQFWDRILLLFTQSEKYPTTHYVRRVPIRRIHLYTSIQMVLLLLLWFDKSNFYAGETIFNTGLLFPLIIAAFPVLRLYVLPRIFSEGELNALSMEDDANISDVGVSV